MNNDNTSIAKGLDALFRTDEDEIKPADVRREVDNIQQIILTQIVPGKYQPRIHFDEKELQELSDSIKENGVIQPILLRKNINNGYELIAGERRWRACKMAGLSTIPAIIRDVTEEVAAAFSLIENIQRHNLDVIEEARALKRLHEEFQLTHEDIAKRLGKPRSSISNILRLLHLPESIQQFISEGKLEHGHGKLLLSLKEEDQISLSQRIMAKNLSVRETETLLQQYKENKVSAVNDEKQELDELTILREILQKHFGAQANIHCNAKGKGKITLPVNSLQNAIALIAKLCDDKPLPS